MARLAFTGDIATDKELVRELLSGIPASARARAKKAACAIEAAYVALCKNHPKDPAIGLGAAFAILTLAERLTQGEPQPGQSEGLIQLLS